jgi:DNA-directed RNA polymerase specialized sigma24 family protein
VTRTIQCEQRALLQRIDKIVRILKYDLHYNGSKDTGDLGGLAVERLVRRDTYARLFREDPKQLWFLVKHLVRHTIIDAQRAEGARRRRPPAGEPLQAIQGTPSVHRDLERRQCLNAVYEELGRFRRGQGWQKEVRANQRGAMADAFELYLSGRYSHSQIGARLGVAKSTVSNWLDFLIQRFARRIAASSDAPAPP